MEKNNSKKTVRLVLCALFAALIAVGAFIKIPIPYIPLTLQTLFTMLAGLMLGGRLGAISVCVYVAIGLAGLPVFSFKMGIPAALMRFASWKIGPRISEWTFFILPAHIIGFTEDSSL